MKSIMPLHRVLALVLAVAMLFGVCNVFLPTLVTATTAESNVILEESFEIGASFIANENSGLETTTAANIYWNGAEPKDTNLFTMYYSSIKDNTNSNVTLAGGVSGAYHGDSCISHTANVANSRMYIKYNLHKNKDVTALMEDGKTYIASVWVKHGASNNGSKVKLVVYKSKEGTVSKTQESLSTEWTKVEVEFVYDAAQSPEIEIEPQNSKAGGITYIDYLTIEEKVEEEQVEVSVTLPETAEVTVGSTITLTPAVTPEDSSVDWSSNNTDVATVDNAGVVTGVSEGTATVTATVGTVSASCVVTVNAAQEEPTSNLIVDESFENFIPNDISGQETTVQGTFYWNGADPVGWSAYLNIPSVLLEANVGGAYDGDYCLKLTPNATSKGRMTLVYFLTDDQNARLENGGEYVIRVWYKTENATYKNVIQMTNANKSVLNKSFAATTDWSAAEASFVMDTSLGSSLKIVVGMQSAGTGALYIDKVTLEPVNKATAIELNATERYLEIGSSFDLTYTLSPSYATSDVVYTSSNDAVASVDGNGKVTAIASGTATITAIASNGNVSAVCTVSVVEKYVELTAITMNQTQLSVTPGWQEQLQVIFDPADATNTKTVWESTNDDIVSVDANGLITAHTVGTATVTATVGTLTASCEITVEEQESFSSVTQEVSVGFGQKLSVNLADLLEGTSYTVITEPARGKLVLSGSTAEYTAYTWQMASDGAFTDAEYADQAVIAVTNDTSTALITLNIKIGTLASLIDWDDEWDLLFSESYLEQIKAELKDPTSLRYDLLQNLLKDADARLVDVAPPYEVPANGVTVSHDSYQRTTGDTTVIYLISYLLTKDLAGYESRNAIYLDKTIEWVKASLNYPFWGTLGAQNGDLAGGQQLFSVAMVYYWLKDELANVTCTHTMGTNGSDWSTVVTEENVPILEAMEKRLWQAGSDMYSVNLSYNVYVMNHLHVRMGGLLAAAIALQNDAQTENEKQTLINWIGMALYKDGYGMNALMPDGTSQEGLPYWEYGATWLMKASMMARAAFGIDFFDMTEVFRNSTDYILYNALPVDFWMSYSNVLNVGDNPGYHYDGPGHILRVIAAEYGDTVAQWLAGVYEDNEVGNTANLWMSVIFADPDVGTTQAAALEELKWFKDMDHVISRSDWSGSEDILSMKTGAPLGKNLMEMVQDGEYVGDPDAGHAHPDANHITLYSNGEYLLRDDGYADKYTSNHNTLLINGEGQMGEGGDWMQEAEYITTDSLPYIKIATSNETEGYDYIVGNATEAYTNNLGLILFERNVVYLKEEKVMLVVDNIQSTSSRDFELRWFPASKHVALSGGVYLISSDANTMNFFAFTEDTTTVFEDVTVYGETVSSSEKTFRQTYSGTAWQNAVAFSWDQLDGEAAFVKYRAGDNNGEHEFCVNGKIYTINVSTNEVTVTEGDFESESGGASDDSTLSTVLLNGVVYDSFTPETTEYTLERWWKTYDLEIAAYSNAFGAKVTVDYSNSEEIKITCVSRDGTSTTEYKITVTNEQGILGIAGAEANASREGYDLTSTYDSVVQIGDNKPLWTVQAPAGGQVIVVYDLAKVVSVNKIDLAMHNSRIRDNYYDINFSIDGESWQSLIADGVFECTADISSNNHATRIVYDGDSFTARYIQIVLRGNSTSGKDVIAYNGIQEITFYGASNGTVLNEEKSKLYTSFTEAVQDAATGQTLILVDDVSMDSSIFLTGQITLDLNGNTLTAPGVTLLKGCHLIDSGTTKGLLAVPEKSIALPTDNAYLPVWNGENGYHFVDVNVEQTSFNNSYTSGLFQFDFKPAFGLLNGSDSVAKTYFIDEEACTDNGITISLLLTWEKEDGSTGEQTFNYSNELVRQVYEQGMVFALKVSGVGSISSLNIQVVVTSSTGVKVYSTPKTYSVS